MLPQQNWSAPCQTSHQLRACVSEAGPIPSPALCKSVWRIRGWRIAFIHGKGCSQIRHWREFGAHVGLSARDYYSRLTRRVYQPKNSMLVDDVRLTVQKNLRKNFLWNFFGLSLSRPASHRHSPAAPGGPCSRAGGGVAGPPFLICLQRALARQHLKPLCGGRSIAA